MADFGRLVSWAKNGTLLDITPYISSSKFPVEKEIPGAIAQYRWAEGDFDTGATNGKYYGLPGDAQCWIFAYNKKMSMMQVCWDLVYTYKVAPQPGTAGQQNPFMSGQVAMTIQGIWVLTDYAAIKDFGWDIAMQPMHPKTGKRTTSMESNGWWLFKGAKEPDTAFNLMSYLARPEGQKLFIAANDCIPSTFQEISQDWYATKPPEHKMKALDNIQSGFKKEWGHLL